MAGKKRDAYGVFSALQKISDEEGIDFGLDNYNKESFKAKYFTGPGNITNLYNKLNKISDEEGVDFGLGTSDEWLESFGYKRAGNGYQTLDGRAVGTSTPRTTSTRSHVGGTGTGDWRQEMIANAGNIARKSQQQVQRTKNQVKYNQKKAGLQVEPVNLGQNPDVVEENTGYWNTETATPKKRYLTSSGTEYDQRAAADLEENINDLQEYEQTVPGQLRKIDEQIASLEQRINDQESQREIDWVDTDGRVHYKDGRTSDEAISNMDLALRDLKNARTMLQRDQQLRKSSDFLGGVGLPFTGDWFNNWKNFGYGIWDSLNDRSMYDFGLSDLQKAGAYMRIKNKIENGEELTEQETDLALAGMALAQAEQSVDLPTGYTAGEITAQMAPFMAQMAANPASGVGRAFARSAVRKFGRDGVKAVAMRAGARVLGNVAEAAALTGTLQAGQTAANIMNRYTGDTFEYDEEGKLHIGHYEEGEDGQPTFVDRGKGVARSIYEGVTSSIIENFTELGFGGNINKFLGKMAASKGGRAIGLGYITDLVGKVGSTPFARGMKKFAERTNWNGLIEEPLEEEYGIILNSLLTGDNKISDLWDSKQQADIFAGTMWFGGFMAGMNLAAYPLARRKMKRDLRTADINGQYAFGDEWDVIKAGIEEMDDNTVVDYLYGLKDDDNFSNEQKAALFAYTSRLKQYQGANTASMLMRMEGNLDENEAALQNAYESGSEAEGPERNEVLKRYEAARQAVAEVLGIDEEEVDSRLGVDELDENAIVDKALQVSFGEQVLEYLNARAAYNGMLDRVGDDIEAQVQASNEEVSRITNEAGQVVGATMKADGSQVYVVSGVPGVAETLVVRNAETGELKMIAPDALESIEEPIDAEELRRQREEEITNATIQQAENEIEGKRQFQPNDVVTLADGRQGQLGPLTPEGAFLLYTNDNKVVPINNDELNELATSVNGTPLEAATVSQQTEPKVEDTENAENYAQNEGENIPEEEVTAEEQQQTEQPVEAEQPQTALSKIPVVRDGAGKPVLNKKGREQLLWHKASVGDTADALTEINGGELVAARDTAQQMISKTQGDLEKIKKAKIKGDDPIEIAESRAAIRAQIDEAQAIVNHWKQVNQEIMRRMSAANAERLAAEEAAKTEQQRQEEAERREAARKEVEERERQEIEAALEADKKKRNQEYAPLVAARKEMAGDDLAMQTLNDTEPRDLEEWVSSLMRPHSIAWQDYEMGGALQRGLKSELGLQRDDMQRFMNLLAPADKGGKSVAHLADEIWNGLPENMQNQYGANDVRNALLDLFREGSSTRMLNLIAEHRIEEAQSIHDYQLQQEQEAELEAWAEAYHLNPDEREAFEAYLEMEPTLPEQEAIDQTTVEYEQSRTSPAMGEQPVNGTAAAGVEGSEEEVQQAPEAASDGVYAEGMAEGPEASGSEPVVSGDEVPGRVRERESLAILFDQIGANVVLAERISDYEVDQLTAMVEDWESYNDDYGSLLEQKKDELKSKDKKVRDAALKEVNKAQEEVSEAFVPIEEYIEGLNTKYGIEEDEPFEGAIPTPKIDYPRLRSIREALVDGYTRNDADAIAAAAQQVRDYVDEGLDDYAENDDTIDEYEGNEPKKLAEQYIARVFMDRYLDDDEDQEYIRTGLKPEMKKQQNEEESDPLKTFVIAARNGNKEAQDRLNKFGIKWEKKPVVRFVAQGEVDSILAGNRYEGRFGNGRVDVTNSMEVSTAATADYRVTFKDDLDWTLNDRLRMKNENLGDGYIMDGYSLEDVATIEKRNEDGTYTKIYDAESPLAPSESVEEIVSLWEMYAALGQKNIPQTLNEIGYGMTEIEEAEKIFNQRHPNGVEEISEDDAKEIYDSIIQEKQQEKMPNGIGTTSTPEKIAEEEGKVDTNPTNGQKEAGNYQKGHIKVDGYDITIENPKGSVRRGTDANGQPWEVTMNNTYGYIRGTEGVDGDHIDVFLSDNPTSGNVFVVDQVKPDGSFDEHKVMYGFADAAEAMQAYLSNYSPGWKGLGAISGISREEFKKWVESSHRKTKPFREYALAKRAAVEQQQMEQREPSAEYTITDAEYKTKRGKVLNMRLVTFDRELTPEEQKAANALAKESKGWWSRNDGGFLMRDEESAQAFAEKVLTPSDMSDAKPLSLEDMQKATDDKQEQQPELTAQAEQQPAQRSQWVDDEDAARFEELKKRMRAKLGGQMNMGVDPEILAIGAEMAFYVVKHGARKFGEYARVMVEELGDAIRPYLKSFYNGAREFPEMEQYADDMTPYEEVRAFDVANFDKPTTDVIAAAQQIVEEQQAEEQAEEAEKQLKDDRNEERKQAEQENTRPATQEDLEQASLVWYQGKKYGIMMLVHEGSQVSATQFEKPHIVRVVLSNGQSVEPDELRVDNTVQPPVEEAEAVQYDLFGNPIQELAKKRAKKNTPKKVQPVKQPKKPWWTDENRPKSLNPSDYKTYMTDEAREYFANFKSADGKTDFTKWVHPNLSFITAAVWDGVEIPYEDLKNVSEIVDAENAIKKAESKGKLTISKEEVDRLAQRLLDKEQARQEQKALIIIGLPAGGKSSVFANPLSKEHGARIIDSDDVKPWLEGFDGGNGAGYVQDASAEVAERAIDLAVRNGDNIVIPRIGGKSVMELSAALRLAGYDVQLYFNDVKGVTSIDRAASRFAQTGRYLSLDYLTKKAGVPSENFSKFAKKTLGEYLDERNQTEVQNIRGRLQRLRGELDVSGEGLRQSSSSEQRGNGTLEELLQTALGGEGLRTGGNGVSLLLGEPLFNYSEWKSNDVPFGEKPKEIWNSKSGKPMSIKKVSDKNYANEQENRRTDRQGSSDVLSGEPSGALPVDSKQLEGSLSVSRNDGEGDSRVQGETAEVLSSSRRSTRPLQELTTDEAAVIQQQTEQQQETTPASPKNLRNNHAERGADYAPKGVDARIEANIKAIELMQQLIEDGKEATPAQMKVLRQYSGWGGLGKAFKEKVSYGESGYNPRLRGDYQPANPISQRLRELLGDEAYEQAVMSRNSAYYTPAAVIDSMWDIARAMGFKGGNVLEGSAGIGNIIGAMPKDMSERSSIHAVEIDQTTGNILSLLYPDAKVEVQGFEQTEVENGSVDLAITNVPFVTGLRVMDTTGDKDLSRKFHDIHDFCIAKNIRKLREGGIGIFISSSGTLDNSKKLREWIVGEGGADVVGAFRLNNETFGGTGATSDIIVVRKRVNGKKSAHVIDVLATTGVRSAEYDTGEEKKVKGVYVPVVKQLSMDYNKYFAEHPENMGGEMKFGFEEDDTFRPTSKALYPVKGKNQSQLLKDWVESFAGKDWETAVVQQQTDRQEENVYEQLGKDVKEGSMVLSRGRLCIAQRGKAVPLELNASKVKGHTKAECFTAYQGIKNSLADVLSYQTENEGDSELKALLDKLNRAYDNFVKVYGHLHKNTSISFLKNDVDWPNILALEKYAERATVDGKRVQEFGKTDVFKQRVVEKEKEPQPTNVKDGIIASIYQFGRIDVPWIVEQLNKVATQSQHTEQGVRAEIVKSGLGFEDPDTKEMIVSYEYLSGNVREKLQQAIDNNSDGRYNANINALEKVVPMDIPAHLIDFTLGSSWIDPKLYEDYVKERTGIEVKFTAAGGTWYMKAPHYLNSEQNRSMGVISEMFHKTILGTQLIEAAMQNKTITVSETHKKWDGSTETIVDKDATAACGNKIDEIRQDFKDWARKRMQTDDEYAKVIERKYNDTFNNYVPKSIPDEFVPEHFGGAATVVNGKPFKLRPHQAKAVIRATTQPLMLAHEVGTGKTFTLISTAMEMRRLGTAKKPMIVVQNATVGQFVESAKELYPNAKVLTLEEADRTADGRKNFYAKIKYNDWDMIVVPQSVFERIPDSEERQMAYIQDKIDEKLAVLEQMKEADNRGDSMIVRQAEKEIEQLEADKAALTQQLTNRKKEKDEKKAAVTRQNAEVRAKEMLDRETDDVENFDDMGIDAILVDEAHEYKHLGFATAMQRGVKGVDPSYSKKAQGVYLKTQAVLEKNNGRNVVFATGTPISNTAAEIWTFMRYLMPADTMKEYGIYYFDDFVRNFGNLQQMLEFTTSGKFKENNRFAGYVNLPELVRIWSGVADTVLTKEAGGVSDKIPDMETGKAIDIYLPQSKALRSVMKYVKATLEEYEKMSGKEKKENSHIPLTMYGIAKAAAVDVRLVLDDSGEVTGHETGQNQAGNSTYDDPNSKTNEAVRQTLKSLEETKSYKGTVAIFADNYQNKRSGFNLYEDIRKKLIAAGVPEDQIVIMKSGMTVKKKLEIFDKVNRGEVRVIMGSTFTLGTGVNIQERLHTLIHVDAPNRPMDYTQRNGRILRQGNLHKEMGKPVRVLRFGVEDSLDVTAYQRLKTKGAIADSIMNGKQMMANSMENRMLEEEEDVFGDTVAQLSGSEYAMLKNQAEKDVRKYEAKRKQYEADQTYVHNQIPKLEGQIKSNQKWIADNKKYLERVEKVSQHTGPLITIGKKKFADLEAMADYIKDFNKSVKAAEDAMRKDSKDDVQVRRLTVNVGGIDFEIKTEISFETKQVGVQLVASTHRDMTYSCPELGIQDAVVSQSLLRNAMTDIVENVVSGSDFRERIERGENIMARNEEDLRRLRERDGKPFEFTDELQKAHERYEEYTELMKKELEEKEKKYAKMDAEVDTAQGVMDADEEDEDGSDEGMRFRMDDDVDQTETFAFKNWFGDWENDPENASKVVDENGKPLVLYHGTNLSQVNRHKKFYVFYEDSHFGTIGQAMDVTRQTKKAMDFHVKNGIPPIRQRTEVYPVYLNIRNPKRVSDVPFDEDEWDGSQREWWDKQVAIAKAQGYDGLVYLNEYEDRDHPADSWIAFYPEQVKSATENIGTFDPDNPDIRLREEGTMEAPRRTQRRTASQQQQSKAYAQRQWRRAHVVAEEAIRLLGLEDRVTVMDFPIGLTGRKAKAKGWYDTKTGKIVVVLNNHRSPEDVFKTILHEGVAHYGLRQLFGEHFDTFLEEVYENATPEIKAAIDQLKAKSRQKNEQLARREATEEYLALLAEDTDFERAMKQGWWQKIKSAFLDMLHKLGFGEYAGPALTDNELRYILWRSHENLQDMARVRDGKQPLRRNVWNPFKAAEDIVMQEKLQVGNFSPTPALPSREGEEPRQAAESKQPAMRVVSMEPRNEAERTYVQFKERYGDAVLLMNDGDNYFALGEDALKMERLLSDRRYLHGRMENGRYVLPLDELDMALPVLVRAGNRIAISEAPDGRTAREGEPEMEWVEDSELQSGDLDRRFRDGGGFTSARAEYEARTAGGAFKFRESWQDSMLALKDLQDAIAAESGEEIEDYENAYLAENRMHGKSKNEAEYYDRNYYQPLKDEVRKLVDYLGEEGVADPFGRDGIATYQTVDDYLKAKHGLERNQVFAFREAAKQKAKEVVDEQKRQLQQDADDGKITTDDLRKELKQLDENFGKAVQDIIDAYNNDNEVLRLKRVYESGLLTYSELLEALVPLRKSYVMRAEPKTDDEGNVVSDNYYDEHVKDYGGLSELMAPEEYATIEALREMASLTVDPVNKRELYKRVRDEEERVFKMASEEAMKAVDAIEVDAAKKEMLDNRTMVPIVYQRETEERRKHIQDLWSRINDATKKTLQTSYEGGMMSREQYNNVRAMFDYYVPLRGWEENNADDVYDYVAKRSAFSPSVKKAYGRASKADSPLATIGNMAVSQIIISNKNLMRQHFLNMVLNHPSSLISVSEKWYVRLGDVDGETVWEEREPDIKPGMTADEIASVIETFNEEMRLKQEQGDAIPAKGKLHLNLHATKAQKDEHVVEVQRNGKVYKLYINGNPRAAQALNGTNITEGDAAWMQTLSRAMAANFTSRNPAFVISNLSRDFTMAAASVVIKENTAYSKRFAANAVKVLRPRMGRAATKSQHTAPTGLLPSLMRKYLRDELDPNNETERYFQEFMDQGGETGFTNMLSVEKFKSKMEKEFKKSAGHEMDLAKAFGIMADTFEFYNRCAEDATRFIVYMTSRQMGKSVVKSIADAKDVTLNFNRKGAGGMGNATFRNVYIFVNPAIQALSNMFEMMTKHKLKFTAVTLSWVAAGAMLPILNTLMLNLLGGDDDKDSYWDLPDYIRKNNAVFWVPGTHTFVTIPLAQEFRVFYGMGELASAMSMGHTPDSWGKETLSSFMDLLPVNPTGAGGDLLVDFMPTPLQPIVQARDNVNFTGYPIYRDNQGNKYEPTWQKAYHGTPSWMVKTSKLLNEATGGNDHYQGWIDGTLTNPALWNHMLQGYLGGMYSFLSHSAGVVTDVASGELPKMYEVPVANRFINVPMEREKKTRLGNEYYDLVEEHNRMQNMMAKYRKDANHVDPDIKETAEHYTNMGKEIDKMIDWERNGKTYEPKEPVDRNFERKYRRYKKIHDYKRQIDKILNGSDAHSDKAEHRVNQLITEMKASLRNTDEDFE